MLRRLYQWIRRRTYRAGGITVQAWESFTVAEDSYMVDEEGNLLRVVPRAFHED